MNEQYVTEDQVEVAEGKYTVILRSDGTSTALRYHEPWPAYAGETQLDNLTVALARDLIDARRKLSSEPLLRYHADPPRSGGAAEGNEAEAAAPSLKDVILDAARHVRARPAGLRGPYVIGDEELDGIIERLGPKSDVENQYTFTVPDGYEAVRDAEGRATGEVRPVAPKPTLAETMASAKAWFDSLTPEQQEEHLREQRKSWARGEMAMGNDAQEAAERYAPPKQFTVRPSDPLAIIAGIRQFGSDLRDLEAALTALTASNDRVAELERERDEAREYGEQARLRENAAEDARIHEHDLRVAAEASLAKAIQELDEALATMTRATEAMVECGNLLADEDLKREAAEAEVSRLKAGAVTDEMVEAALLAVGGQRAGRYSMRTALEAALSNQAGASK